MYQVMRQFETMTEVNPAQLWSEHETRDEAQEEIDAIASRDTGFGFEDGAVGQDLMFGIARYWIDED